MDLATDMYFLGSLIDINEDLDRGTVQIPLNKLNILHDKKAFEEEKIKRMKLTRDNAVAVFDTSMPVWQQLVAYSYILTRVQHKCRTKAKFPNIENMTVA